MIKQISTMTGSRKKGFTIIELLAVAVLVALMAGSTFIFGLNRYKTAMVRHTASKFMLAAKYARLSAVENQSRCRLVINETDKKFFLMSKIKDRSTGVKELSVVSNPYTRPVEIDDSVSFAGIEITPSNPGNAGNSDGEHVINFMPDGTCDTAVIKFTNGSTFYTVTIASATAKAIVFQGQDADIPIDIIDLDKDSNFGSL